KWPPTPANFDTRPRSRPGQFLKKLLGRGFLTGRFQRPEDLPEDDFRRHHPRFQGENFQKNLQLVKIIQEMAEAKGATPAQLAISWVLAQGDDIVPIPGTKRRTYLEENAQAVTIHWSPAELQRISDAFPTGSTAGARYADMSTVNR
ncbi:aldo/keto reductase, partial [Sulfobacillus harzensis]